MFYPIVVLGTGFAIEIGFVYLVNKAMTKLLADGHSFCCPKPKTLSVSIYTDCGGIAPVPDDDANDENEWNAQAEKQKLSETIPPAPRSVVKARPNGDVRRRVPIKTKPQTSHVSEAAQKQFLDSIKEEDTSRGLCYRSSHNRRDL